MGTGRVSAHGVEGDGGGTEGSSPPRSVCCRVVLGCLVACLLALQVVTILMLTGVIPVTLNVQNGAGDGGQASIVKSFYGKTSDGEDVHRYTLTNTNDVTLEIITYGGIMTRLLVPDKDGVVEDIVLGYSSLADYEVNEPHFGSLIGRVANRIANGTFRLDGTTYQLDLNAPPHHLHGGRKGWDKFVWESDQEGDHVTLRLNSPDGDQKYPGEVRVTVTYQLTNENEVVINYTAHAYGKATPINLTSHPYFNLAGEGTSTIEDHVVRINSKQYLETDVDLIPTGSLMNVAGTLYDFRNGSILGDVIHRVYYDGINEGYDNTYVLGGPTGLKFAARVEHPASGRALAVYTNQPALVFYTSNMLSAAGKHDYGKQSSLCLETQNHPDAINHAGFPDSVLRPGSTYFQQCIYKLYSSL